MSGGAPGPYTGEQSRMAARQERMSEKIDEVGTKVAQLEVKTEHVSRRVDEILDTMKWIGRLVLSLVIVAVVGTVIVSIGIESK